MSACGARIVAEGLGFTYVGARAPALAGVDLDLVPGSETWVTGPNVAGKTTLLLMLAGVIPTVMEGRVTGSLQIEGRDGGTSVVPAMVMQDAGVYLFRTVFDEIAFPLENCGVSESDLESAVRDALGLLGIEDLQARLMHTLSGGERQKVSVAAALAVRPDLLLLDEPFEQLDPASVSEVLGLARLRAAAGATLVVATREETQVPDGPARIRLSGGTVCAHSAPPLADGSQTSSRLGDPVLEIGGLTHRYTSGAGIVDVDITVRAGESVAVLGPNGAGKTTLMRHTIGLLRPDSGCVRVCGEDAGPRAIWDLAHDVGLLFQNPDDQVFNRVVEAEVAWGLLVRGVAKDIAVTRAREVMVELGIEELAEENPHEITASQRQLVAFASVLVAEPRLIVLDEPTKALDCVAAETVARAIDRRLEQGAGVLVVTHDLRFASRVADRCVVLAGGRVIADGRSDDVLADEAMLHEARLLASTGRTER